MAAQPVVRLELASGDPWGDPTPAQPPAAARVVVPLVAVLLGRPLARPPWAPSDHPEYTYDLIDWITILVIGSLRTNSRGADATSSLLVGGMRSQRLHTPTSETR